MIESSREECVPYMNNSGKERVNRRNHLGECILVQSLWTTVWRFLKKLKTEFLYDLTVPPLGIYPDKTVIQEDMCTLMCIAALFTIAKKWMKPKCLLTDEWVMKNYSTIKKNEKLPFSAIWIELDILMLSEKRKKKTNFIWYQLHVESKIWHKWTYLWNKQTHRHRLVADKLGVMQVEEKWIWSLGLAESNYYI